jgi:YegS/Rv2252/BmrU family lipid kinase
MTRVAVIAHQGKILGGGLGELRAELNNSGVEDPLWYEVPKSRKAPKVAKRAVKEGAELVFVWGGDGMVQRCVDALAGSGVTIAILPAGTANLLASNLGVPKKLAEAVAIGMHGQSRALDVGVVNGERFVVMAGAGLDARMIRDADGSMKNHFGRAAYVWTGAKAMRGAPTRVKVRVDGKTWFVGKAACVLVGNVGTVTGGLEVFDSAEPDDGWLDLGVVTAEGAVQWLRVLARMAAGQTEKSPLTQITRGHRINIRLDRKTPYELDGGDRPPASKLKVRIEPGAISVRVSNGAPA